MGRIGPALGKVKWLPETPSTWTPLRSLLSAGWAFAESGDLIQPPEMPR